MSKWHKLALAMSNVLLLLCCGAGARAAEIDVMCPPPLRATLTELAPLFEHASGHHLLVSYEPSRAIIDHIKRGDVPDIAILTASNIDDLGAQGLLVSRVDLVHSRIGIAVRSGAAQPDVASVEGFKRTLLASKSFARNDGADSGVYMASLLERLGIAASMRVYFSDTVGSPGPSLFTIDTAGRNQQRVPTPSFASDPAWSPLLS